ncbi:MAG TPA: alpha-1,2-fucosyltransferase [Candidatus Paceibacterota bacterium]
MIIVRIFGGLGNQMFQYAYGRARANAIHTKLALDISSYERTGQNTTPRVFGLAAWRTQVTRIATANDFRAIGIPAPYDQSLLARLRRRMTRILEGAKRVSRRRAVYEPESNFDPDYLFISDNAYLVGNWQSEKYFLDDAANIRDEFQPASPLSEKAQALLKEVTVGTSVGIHVRRGDYVNDPRVIQKVGTLPLSYYHKAVAYISSHVAIDRLYVFSDDIAWCKTNLSFEFPTTYVSKEFKDWESLWLMSRCTHAIIARSSFSWWAAWLNPNQDKIIVAPRGRRTISDPRDADFAPSSWIRL